MFPTTQTFKRLFTATRTSKWMLASAAAVALAVPGIAQAGTRDSVQVSDHRVIEHRDSDYRDIGHRDTDHRDIGRDDHDRGGRFDIDIHLGDRRPEVRQREVRVWVPPVYRTVVDRRWVEPVYSTVCEQVLVPARFEDREVRVRDRGRTYIRIEHVLVAPAHYESHDRQVCVTEGHFETVERQELVAEGHYVTQIETVRAPERTSPFAVVNPMLGGFTFHADR